MWVTTLAVFPLMLVLWGLLVLHDPFALVLVLVYPYAALLSSITFLPALLCGWWVARRLASPGVSEFAFAAVAVAVHYLLFVCMWDYAADGHAGPAAQVVPGGLTILLFLGWMVCRKGGIVIKK